jgi:hypothetical protein
MEKSPDLKSLHGDPRFDALVAGPWGDRKL